MSNFALRFVQTKKVGVLIKGAIIADCIIVSLLQAMSPPVISGGTLRTADGDLLRGGSLHISKSYSSRANGWGANRDSLILWRDKIHYNCIRLCELDARAVMDGRSASAFATVEESFPLVDAVINNAESLGIYVILNYHCPEGNWDKGEWDIRNFWKKYAPRYKDRAHVVYELFNEGSHGGPDIGDWGNIQVYPVVRGLVPNKIIISGSVAWYAGSDWIPFLRDQLTRDCGFSWNSGKDVWGFHAYDGQTTDVIYQTQAAGIPVFCTEYSYVEEGSVGGTLVIEGCKYPAQWMEKKSISWMDWVLWNRADQSYPRMTWLIPDATSKGWAWWTPTAVTVPRQVASAKPSAGIARSAFPAVLANGRVNSDKSASGGAKNKTVRFSRISTVNK